MHFLKFKKPILTFFCMLLFTLVPTSLLSQVILPNTPAGNRANEILILINSGVAEKTEEYVSDNYAQSFKDAFPMDRHVGLFKMMNEKHKTLELIKTNSSNDYDIDFLLHSKTTDAWVNVKLWVEEKDPYLISRMGVQPGSAPDDWSDKTIESQDASRITNETKSKAYSQITKEVLTKLLDDLINELVSKDEFSGIDSGNPKRRDNL